VVQITKNIIHYILFITGIIVIFTGFFTSITTGGNEIFNEFDELSSNSSFSIMLSILLPYIVIGIALIGLSEVVNLMQKLVNHFVGVPEKEESILNDLVEKKDIGEVSLESKIEIKMFYEKKSIEIDDILSTKLVDFYIVIRGSEKDLIELGSFQPIIVSDERLKRSQTLRDLLQ